MYFLVAVAVGILLHKMWPNFIKAKSPLPDQRGTSKQPSDWLRRWWSSSNLDAQDKSTPEEYRHFLHLTLRTCTVGLVVRTEKATEEFTARVFFPTVIPDNRFHQIQELMDEYNEINGHSPLELERNHGTLWLHTRVDGEIIKRSTEEEREKILHELFSRVDMVFPEVMKVIYGFNMPALAVMKIAGMRQKQLN